MTQHTPNRIEQALDDMERQLQEAGTPVCDRCGDEGSGAEPGQKCGRHEWDRSGTFLDIRKVCDGTYRASKSA